MSGSGRRTRAGCSLRSIPRSPARDRRCSRRQVRRRTISAAEPDQDQVVPAGCLKVENARVRVKAPRRAFLPLKTEGVAGAGELQPPLHRDTRPPIRRGWVSASQRTSPSPGRRLNPWQEWQGSAFVRVRSRSLALTEPCKQLFGANGCEQERTAARSCHAEGRGFESHHPLSLKPRSGGDHEDGGHGRRNDEGRSGTVVVSPCRRGDRAGARHPCQPHDRCSARARSRPRDRFLRRLALATGACLAAG
jgi:hypothetical protein